MRIDPLFLNQELRDCLNIDVLIRFNTKINGKKCKCLLTKWRDGSCRVISIKNIYWLSFREIEELYSTQDSLESSFTVNEILFADKSKCKIIKIWMRGIN